MIFNSRRFPAFVLKYQTSKYSIDIKKQNFNVQYVAIYMLKKLSHTKYNYTVICKSTARQRQHHTRSTILEQCFLCFRAACVCSMSHTIIVRSDQVICGFCRSVKRNYRRTKQLRIQTRRSQSYSEFERDNYIGELGRVLEGRYSKMIEQE